MMDMKRKLWFYIITNVLILMTTYSPVHSLAWVDTWIDEDRCDCQPYKEPGEVWSLTICCHGDELEHVPQNLTKEVTRLLLRSGKIRQINAGDFQRYQRLSILSIKSMHDLTYVDAEAFKPLGILYKLAIVHCPNLKWINGTLLEQNPRMLTMRLNNNGLEVMPKIQMSALKRGSNIPSVDLSHNKIRRINSGTVINVTLQSLYLEDNELEVIESHSFSQFKIKTILNKNPKLTYISPNAFDAGSELTTLDVSHTSIRSLPEKGLNSLERLYVRATETLKMLPSVLAFTNLKLTEFTYSHHCCFFQYLRPGMPYDANMEAVRRKFCNETDEVEMPQNETANARKPRYIKSMGSWGAYSEPLNTSWANLSKSLRAFGLQGELGAPIPHNRTMDQTMTDPSDLIGGNKFRWCRDKNKENNILEYYRNISCTPQPDALNPCEDITGYIFLRVFIWFVWVAAVLGNVAVLTVLLITYNRRVKVHNFLVANLAFADLCMGIYLAMLAIEDIRTSGEYYNYAVDWQTGAGCKMTGFLCVFASTLSVYTMLIISFDVWYNTRYVFWGKSLSFKVCILLMLVGWVYSLSMATFPLFSTASYSATSTCLPLDIQTNSDKLFLVSGLAFNTAAFCLMCVSYVGIYVSVACSSHKSGSPSVQAQDVMLAKRMAILIGTNFICWGPTILFGITAIVHQPLIDISTSKFLLIVFYPINSCANPFLYVLLTRQYRKDLSRVLRRNEALRKLLPGRARKGADGESSFGSKTRGTGTATPMTTVTSSSSTSNSNNKTPRSSNGSLQSTVSVKTGETMALIQGDGNNASSLGGKESSFISRRLMSFSRRMQFTPQMSDIVENSHSSSADDQQAFPENYFDLLPQEGKMSMQQQNCAKNQNLLSASNEKLEKSEKPEKEKLHRQHSSPSATKSCSPTARRKKSFVDQLMLRLAEVHPDAEINEEDFTDDMDRQEDWYTKYCLNQAKPEAEVHFDASMKSLTAVQRKKSVEKRRPSLTPSELSNYEFTDDTPTVPLSGSLT